jgi:glucuronate isomerase
MKTFITEHFLLQTDFARRLFHSYAKDLPIIDYHCHLQPELIADNHPFRTLTEIWLKGDHYKWRAMRTLGIEEKFITGNASDQHKFNQWAATVPYTMRNPLYHWTHLELERYFGIRELLTPETASSIYGISNEQLALPENYTQALLNKFKVEVICTTDDPSDSLDAHKKISALNLGIAVLPTFRPDKAYAVDNTNSYHQYLKKLGMAAKIEIRSFHSLLTALKNRIEYFHSVGARLSDHGLEQLYFPSANNRHDPEKLFQKVLQGHTLTADEVAYFKYAVLLELGKLYHSKQWTQQFHLGALRNTNERMLGLLGADTGFDSIGDFPQSASTANFLNALDSTNQLAKTILYNLNPADNEVMATMIGNFNDGSVKGKIQFGSAWWFLDQKDGMEKQINALSNLGMLSCFIGMLTDSRSFMSYPRHEYFRRILCNIIGNDVERGELPADEKWLGKLVSDISYHNAKGYFNFVNQAAPTYAEKA